MATTERRTADIDRARLKELTERERAQFLERTQGSQAKFDRAVQVMPKGVPSSFQAGEPRPIYLSHGEGSRVWDVDGNEYVDFHNGFGVMCVGHAQPGDRRGGVRARGARHALRRADRGLDQVAEELRRRLGLPQWRFTNSGTESTMDAIHLARGATGRDIIAEDRGHLPRPPRRRDGLGASRRPSRWATATSPSSLPYGLGYPDAIRRADPRGAVQRRRRAGARARAVEASPA